LWFIGQGNFKWLAGPPGFQREWAAHLASSRVLAVKRERQLGRLDADRAE